MSNDRQPYPNPSNDPDQQGSHAAGQGQHGQDQHAQHAQQQHGQPQDQYGQPQQQYGQPQQTGWGDPALGGTGKPKNGLAVVGLVLAILGLLLCWLPVVGLVLGLLGLILGIVGLRRVKKHLASNRGVSLGAVIIGVIATVAGAAFTAFWIWFAVFAANNGGADLARCLSDAQNDQTAITQCQQQFNDDMMGSSSDS